MSVLYFDCPPLPHFIVGGYSMIQPGSKHISRSRIGVFDLIAVTEGMLPIAENDGGTTVEWSVQAGQYVILQPDRYHYSPQACTSVTRFHWIHFQTAGEWGLIDQRTRQPDSGSYGYAVNRPFWLPLRRYAALEQPQAAIDLLQEIELLERQPTVHSNIRQQQLFHRFLMLLCSSQQSLPVTPAYQVAHAAAVYLKQHYKQPFRSEHLSEELRFHYAYINRCMKKTFGTTAVDYLNAHRLEAAKLLLVNTSMIIEEIAEEVGFGSTSYFTRLFKQQLQTTPSEFRNQYRLMPNKADK